LELGQTDKALRYLRLDNGSKWANRLLPGILLREGKIEEAKLASEHLSDNPPWFGGLLKTCLERPSEMPIATEQYWPALNSLPDAEMRYFHASLLAFCGERHRALKLLRSAITQNYCAVSALNNDPLWNRLRNSPDFDDVRSEAAECQRKFLASWASGSGS